MEVSKKTPIDIYDQILNLWAKSENFSISNLDFCLFLFQDEFSEEPG